MIASKPVALVTRDRRGIECAIAKDLSKANRRSAGDVADLTGVTMLPCHLYDPPSALIDCVSVLVRMPDKPEYEEGGYYGNEARTQQNRPKGVSIADSADQESR